jgi:hypothetical protein
MMQRDFAGSLEIFTSQKVKWPLFPEKVAILVAQSVEAAD